MPAYEIFNPDTANYVGPFTSLDDVVAYARVLPESVQEQLTVEYEGADGEYSTALTGPELVSRIQSDVEFPGIELSPVQVSSIGPVAVLDLIEVLPADWADDDQPEEQGGILTRLLRLSRGDRAGYGPTFDLRLDPRRDATPELLA